MDKRTIYDIQNTIGYQFNHKSLLEQAFVRSSYANEHPDFLDNEKLEFYGDAALDYYITRCMYEEFFIKTKDGRFKSAKNEQELTQIKSYYVDTDSLAHCIEITGLQNYLQMNDSDIKNNTQNQKSVMADLFEAIIGAVVVDSNWDYEKISKVCSNMLKLKKFEINYIKWLNNYCAEHGFKKPDISATSNIQFGVAMDQLNKNVFPNYSQLPTGFINNNQYPYGDINLPYQQNTIHFIDVDEPINGAFLNIEELGLETFSEIDTRYEAYMDCAKKAYDKIQIIEMRNTIKEPSKENAVNQLNVLYQKGFIHEPIYEYSEEHDDDGNPIWFCNCYVEELKATFFGKSSIKKEAKKETAFGALCGLFCYDEKKFKDDDLEESE